MVSLRDIFIRKNEKNNGIQCRKCDIEHSLSDDRCLRCIVERTGESRPDRIMLDSSVDIVYEGELCSLLTRVSNCVTSGMERFSEGKDCKGCRISRTSLKEEIWSDLSADNLERIRETISNVTVNCPGFTECQERTCSSLENMGSKLSEISDDCTLIAHRLLGA